MQKLYKYRPLSEFLFKELYYQELYFASYNELNDPLDLFARIEFSTKDKNEVKNLIRFIFKTQFYFDKNNKPNENITKLLKFINDRQAKELLVIEILENIKKALKENSQIWTSGIIKIITESIKNQNIDIVFDSDRFKFELERLTDKFLKNSYVNCLSETNDNFLMWSHYASKHSGVCLEFNFKNKRFFPYEIIGARKRNDVKYKEQMSEWEIEAYLYWSKINKVKYQDEQPYINFHKFSVVFENEDDCDLIGLSKSWTHHYAEELKSLFSCKAKAWAYENEWRAIEINFKSPKEPEERIRHYPIECLSSVYFGVNTPENFRNRIYKILNKKNKDIRFFESILKDTDSMTFLSWEYCLE